MFYIPKLSGAHCKLGNLMKQNDGHHSVLSSLLFLRLIFILFFHLLDIFGCCTSFVCLSLWGYTRICVAVLAARKKNNKWNGQPLSFGRNFGTCGSLTTYSSSYCVLRREGHTTSYTESHDKCDTRNKKKKERKRKYKSSRWHDQLSDTWEFH